MNLFKFGNFIELDKDDTLNSIKIGKNKYSYSIQGMNIYMIGVPVPIIRKRVGCLGLAVPQKFTVTENTTTVEFTITAIDKTAELIYYNLYKNFVNMNISNDTDIYDADVLIPGAIMSSNSSMKHPKMTGKRNNVNKDEVFGSIFGRMDSRVDDDDDEW